MRTAHWTLLFAALAVSSLICVGQLSGTEPASGTVTVAKAPSKTPSAAPSTAPVGVGEHDWGQWGGSSVRNNTPEGEDIPVEWNIGEFDLQTGEWNDEEAENVRWVASLGSQSYGNPVVANGHVYVGTNNGAGYLKRYPPTEDLGVLACFDEETGKFLWQDSNEKLPTGRVHDWPLQGVCAAPLVEGDRLWYVSNRGEVLCLDTEGFYDDQDDGPVTNEPARLFTLAASDNAEEDKLPGILAALKEGKVSDDLSALFASSGLELPSDAKVAAEGKNFNITFTPESGVEREVELRTAGPSRLTAYKILNTDDKHDADVVWRLDMMKELGVSQHNMCSCSVTAAGDWLFVNTSNGVDEGHVNLPAPAAPSFLCVEKNTGKVLWTDNTPGENVLHGQWSSPAYAVLGGVPQVIFGAGDGWLYSFDAAKSVAEGKPVMLWKFDCNPKESKYVLGGRADRNHIIGTPVVYDGLVYIGVGEDPEHGEGVGHLWCIDPTKRGDVSPELAFNVDDLSTPIPHKRMQAVVPENGEVARANPNSAMVWHYAEYDSNGDGEIDFEETMHRTCGTVAIKDDLLFVADFSGLFHCLNAKTGVPHWKYDMLAAAWGSPLIVDDKVYVGDEDGDICVFKLSQDMELLAENTMENSVYSTPVVANNTLFIANKDHVFAIEKEDK
ncbi:MAG: serine/threonine protein kinase [Planctomycetota bacterium]|nr:MAG: serine/threonine protein kinase [Planctomycetota bacterium]